MARYTWLLDPGHGGIIDGVYQTAGKSSPDRLQMVQRRCCAEG